MKKTDFIDLPDGWTGVGVVHSASRTLFHRAAFAVLLLLVLIHECVLPFGKLGESRTFSTTLSWYFLGGATILALEAKPYQAVLEGIGKLYASNLIAGSYQLLNALALFLIALATEEIALVALAACGLSGLQYLAYQRAFKAFTKLSPSCAYPPGLIKKLWEVSASLGQVNLAALMVSAIQVPLLSFLSGPIEVTGFYLLQKLSQSLTLAVMQIAVSQLPLFTQELGAGLIVAARRRLIRTAIFSYAQVTIAALGFYLLSPYVVEIFLGRQEYVTRELVGLMTLDQMLFGWCVVWSRYVIASGSNPFWGSTVAGAVLNVALCLLLIRRFGLIGLVSASLVSGLCTHYWFNVWKGFQLLARLKP